MLKRATIGEMKVYFLFISWLFLWHSISGSAQDRPNQIIIHIPGLPSIFSDISEAPIKMKNTNNDVSKSMISHIMIVDQYSLKVPTLLIIDGLPINSKLINEDLNTDIIKSITVKRDTVYDFEGKATYFGLVIVSSKDSCNTGLKNILHITDNWILSHPLAEFVLDGKTLDQDAIKINEFFQLDRSMIDRIKIIEPNKKKKYKNGALLIKTK